MMDTAPVSHPVIPALRQAQDRPGCARAGIHCHEWTPAFAGVTVSQWRSPSAGVTVSQWTSPSAGVTVFGKGCGHE